MNQTTIDDVRTAALRAAEALVVAMWWIEAGMPVDVRSDVRFTLGCALSALDGVDVRPTRKGVS